MTHPDRINIAFEGWDEGIRKWLECAIAIYPDDVCGTDYVRADIVRNAIKEFCDSAKYDQAVTSRAAAWLAQIDTP